MRYLLIALLLFPSVSTAQILCASRDDIVKELERDYDERQVGIGVAASGHIIELFVSSGWPQTWTIISTNHASRSCYVAAGEGWETRPKLVGEES